MTDPSFDETDWIARLARALEDVAANARPSYSPLPPEIMRSGPYDAYWHALHRGYRTLAARAKHDASAAKQFNESHLWLDSDPIEAMAILRQHPLVKPGLAGTGTNEGVGFRVLNKYFLAGLSSVASRLAKLSVKEGGGEVAERFHRYLVVATDRCGAGEGDRSFPRTGCGSPRRSRPWRLSRPPMSS